MVVGCGSGDGGAGVAAFAGAVSLCAEVEGAAVLSGVAGAAAAVDGFEDCCPAAVTAAKSAAAKINFEVRMTFSPGFYRTLLEKIPFQNWL
jgi:hypothetical protein